MLKIVNEINLFDLFKENRIHFVVLGGRKEPAKNYDIIFKYLSLQEKYEKESYTSLQFIGSV